MKKIEGLIVLILVIFVSSCTPKSAEKSTDNQMISNPDSLMDAWNQAWNMKDSLEISKMFTDQTQVIFSATEILIGGDSIMAKWVLKNLPQVRNLKTNKYLSGATHAMGYYAGSYTLDIVRNDSIIATDNGSFTAIWKKQEDKNWKMDLMFFGEH